MSQENPVAQEFVTPDPAMSRRARSGGWRRRYPSWGQQVISTADDATVTQPVLWMASVEAMVQAGVGVFVELGAGRVLSGLIRKIDRKLTCHSVRDPESLEQTVEALKAAGYAFSASA